MSLSKSAEESKLSPEDFLTPPKIDGMGFLLISFLSVIVGFIGGIIEVTGVFLFFGTFSFESGISPVLLAMITFFALTLSNFIFLWWLSNIFSQIFTRARTFFVQVSIFSAILYIVILPMYLVFASWYQDPRLLFLPYQMHILLNLLGLFILTGIISYYRYSILNFYASIFSFVITGIVLYLVSMRFSTSGGAIFNLLGSIALSFSVFTCTSFLFVSLYRIFYITTGIDPIGNVFESIKKEEQELEKQAEKNLLM